MCLSITVQTYQIEPLGLVSTNLIRPPKLIFVFEILGGGILGMKSENRFFIYMAYFVQGMYFAHLLYFSLILLTHSHSLFYERVKISDDFLNWR